MMEILTIISNILLASLTAAYVVITKKLLDAAVVSNQQSRSLNIENQRIQLFPHISCHASNTDGDIGYSIQNNSDNAASDVDLIIIGIYHTDDYDLKSFINDYGDIAYINDLNINSTEEGFFGVCHRHIYYAVPPHKQVDCNLYFPVEPDSLYILLQFRDVLGNNYFRVYWLMKDSYEDKRLKIGGIEPNRIKTWARIDIDRRGKQYVLKTQSGEPLPPEVQGSNFHDYYQCSIPIGLIKGASRQVEDPGVWKSI